MASTKKSNIVSVRFFFAEAIACKIIVFPYTEKKLSFKKILNINVVRRLFEDHLDQHLELYVEGKLSASQRRILMTKWVSQALKKISGMKESIRRSFEKCGLSVALDGSENVQLSMMTFRTMKCLNDL